MRAPGSHAAVMKTTVWRNEELALEFTNTTAAGLGDATGLRGSTAAGNYYVALHTALPDQTGANQSTNECTYTGYARTPIARSGAGFTVSGGAVVPISAIGFPQNTGSPQTARFFSIGDASTGATKFRRYGAIGTAMKPFTATDTAGDTMKLPGHGLTALDEIVFWATTDQALPTGITEGIVYFVKTTPDADTITISATSGGATLDITAVGAGRYQKVTPLTVGSGITPSLNTSTTFAEA